jgi:hypothetical protein
MLSGLFRRLVASGKNRGPRRNRCRPRVEALEARDLPAPLAWFAGPNLPTPVGGAVAAADQGSAFTFLGGGPLAVLTVNPADPAWTATSWSDPSLDDRTSISPGIGILGAGSLLVFGGDQGGAVADAIQYHTATGAQTVASMHTPRALLGSATDQQGNVYAIGGIDENGTPLASAEYYTQSTNTWTLTAPLPQTLYAESAAADNAGHLFTFGGVGANGSITANVYEYTIATNTWTQAASMPLAVRDSAAVLGSNGRIYVLGGTTASGATAAVESYDPTSNTWSTETPLPGAVRSEAVVTDSLGRIEVLGGFDANGNPLASVWVSQKLNAPDSVPVFTTTAPTRAVVGNPYSYQVYTTANPQATYSLTTAPVGMTIDPNTGLVSWTPTLAEAGTQNVTIQASNYAGPTPQSYSVTVTIPPPNPPTGLQVTGSGISSLTLSWNPATGPYPITQYNVYHWYQTGHSGRGGGTTTHHDLMGTTTGTSFTINGLYSGTTYTYDVTAVDSSGAQSAYSNNINGTTQPDTIPPTLTVPPNSTVTTGNSYGATDPGAFTATASDPGPGIDNISIAYLFGPYQIFSPSTYIFPVGTTTVTVIASDLYGNSARGSFNVTVIDSAPVLTLPPNQLVEQAGPAGSTDPAAFTATATDPVDSVTSITYAVGSTTIDPSYVFAPGTTTVTVTATDASGYSSTGTFAVTVEDIPPTLNISGLPAGNTVTEGTALNLTATGSAATSAENASGLTFSWNVSRTHNGVTTPNYASGSGTGSSVPIAFTADDEGTYTLSVTATDVNGASTTTTETLTSTAVAPTTGVSGPADGVPFQGRTFVLTANSPSPTDQAAPYSFAINWGDGNTQTVSGPSGTAVSHTYAATGAYTVSVTATDDDGYVGSTASQTVTVKTAEVQNDSATQGGVTGLAIGGTAGNDTFAISTGSTSGTVAVKLNGVSLGTFTPAGGVIDVFGGGGTNGITFSAPSGAGTFSLHGQTLTYANSGTGVPLFNLTLVAAPDVQNLLVQGGNTASTYAVQDATLATTLTAGAGNDTFTFADTGAATQPVTVNGGGGVNTLAGANLANVWSLTGSGAGTLQAGGEPTDTFTGIQNLTGGAAADTFRLATSTAAVSGSIDGKGGANTLDLSGRTTAETVTLQTTGLDKATGISGTFANVQAVIAGTAATNTLVGPNAATAWAVNATNAGSVAGLSFAGFANLSGGSAADTFAFSGAGTITGGLNGGGGANTLDLSAAAGPVTVNLQTRKATPVGGAWANVSNFVGDNATSTLVGANTTNTWTLTATNAGKVGSVAFTGFANLTGGSGADTFKLANGVGVSGTLNGGGGTDTLDDSAYQSGVVINLLLGTATNVGAIANIQNAKSGTGNSILVGNGAANVLTAAGGNNLLIGGAGSDTVTGGTGSDILIAGTTSYDQSPTALAAILSLWANTSNSYAARVAAVMSPSFQYHLDATTVFDDAAPDKLTGGPGLSLFFAHTGGTTGDTTNARSGETVVQI